MTTFADWSRTTEEETHETGQQTPFTRNAIKDWQDSKSSPETTFEESNQHLVDRKLLPPVEFLHEGSGPEEISSGTSPGVSTLEAGDNGGGSTGHPHHCHHGGRHHNQQGESKGGDPSEGSSSASGYTSGEILVDKLLSDPAMIQALSDAAQTMSPQGLAELEQSLSRSLTLNPYTNDSMLAQQATSQLTQDGASAADLSAMQSVVSALTASAGGDSSTPVTTSPTGGESGIPVTTTPTGSDSGTPVTTLPTGGDSGTPVTTLPTGGDSGTPVTTSPTGSDSVPPVTTSPTGDNSGANNANQGDAGNAPSSLSANGNYTVQNGRLYAPDGKEALLNGIVLNEGAAQNLLNPADAQKEIQNLQQGHFNFVRISWGVTNSDGTVNLQNMETIAKELNSAGMAAQFEFTYGLANNEGVASGSLLTTAENWYAQAAEAFKNNPNVFLATPLESGDGTNNPGDPNNNAAWLNQSEGILKAIAGTGYKNAVMVDDTDWAASAINGNPSSSPLIQDSQQLHDLYPNLIAAEHVYQNGTYEGSASTNLANAISALQAAGYNPFFQEVGIDNPSDNPQDSDLVGAEAALSSATMKAGVGYAAFSDNYTSGTNAIGGAWPASNVQADVIDENGNYTAWGQKVEAQNIADQQYLASQ